MDIRIPFEPKEILTIPARANSQLYIQIANPELKEGYVPKLNLAEGVYLGNALVTVRDGKALTCNKYDRRRLRRICAHCTNIRIQ